MSRKIAEPGRTFMKVSTEPGLSLEDVAILADGTGNIPDDTAERLRPFIRETRRLAEPLAKLRQMAADAGTDFLADGLDTFESLRRLRARLWKRPADVLGTELDIPYNELISMAGAMAERADGEEKAELQELKQRLIAAFGDDLSRQRFFQALLFQLLSVEEDVAEVALEKLLQLYRTRRASGGRVGAGHD